MDTRDLNDRDIQNLLRMAGEINRLEAGEFERETAPLYRIQPSRRDPFRLVRVGGLSALAAGVVLAGVVSLKFALPSPAPSVNPGPGMTQQTAPPSHEAGSQLASATAEQGCVVLTVFRDDQGACKCVQMQTHELSDGNLEDLPRAELLRLALKAPCSTTAQRVLVLAVSGRADMLPRTHEDAEAIARGLGDAHGDPSTLAYAAMPTLPPDSVVVAETVTWNKPALAIQTNFPAAAFLR
jgi:hypothetical protein